MKLTSLLLLLILKSLFGLSIKAQSTLSHDNYWTIRPLSWVTLNPNIQLGTRLPAKDSLRRIYYELSLTYPLGKTFLDRSIYFNDININFIGLEFEQRWRFSNRFNHFWAPVVEVDYRRYSYFHDSFKLSQPDMNYINFRLGFENGKFRINSKKRVQAFYWGVALRYALNLNHQKLHYSIGDVEYNYWGLKLYLNWQIGSGYKAVYPRKY